MSRTISSSRRVCLLDHDLKIQNNHERGDYTAYFFGELRPHYLRRGIDEQIYSIHSPGISVLVFPAFADRRLCRRGGDRSSR